MDAQHQLTQPTAPASAAGKRKGRRPGAPGSTLGLFLYLPLDLIGFLVFTFLPTIAAFGFSITNLTLQNVGT